jgi:hypothetical protein
MSVETEDIEMYREIFGTDKWEWGIYPTNASSLKIAMDEVCAEAAAIAIAELMTGLSPAISEGKLVLLWEELGKRVDKISIQSLVKELTDFYALGIISTAELEGELAVFEHCVELMKKSLKEKATE